MTYAGSIPQKGFSVNNLSDLMKLTCPHCGGSLGVDYAHLGGHTGSVAFVVCESLGCANYYLQIIPHQLAAEYFDLVETMATAFGCHEEDNCEEVPDD